MKKLFLFVVVLLSLSKIKAQQIVPVVSKDTTIKKIPQSTIAIVTLRIAQSSDQYTASIARMSLLHSSKIFSMEKSSKINTDDFVCIVLDKNKKSVDTLKISMPLKVRYEYPSEDGRIASTAVDVKEKEVILRFSYQADMKYLRIAKPGKNKKMKNFITLLLPEATVNNN